MILTAHQPAYLPWLGLFHKIALADQFVCFDHVQHSSHDYAARNSIKTSQGTLRLIEQLAGEGIKPIYLSSDTVFDGKKGSYTDEELLNPINEYGKQRAEIEQRMAEICKENYLIVRLTKIFALSHGDGTILDDMASVLTSEGTIRAAYDQIFSVTLLSDVVNVIQLLQKNNVTGVVNVSSPEVWSRYDLALKMADCLGVSSKKIERMSYAKCISISNKN